MKISHKRKLMTAVGALALVTALSLFAGKSQAEKNGPACRKFCAEQADKNYSRGTELWSKFYDGCLLTCDM